VTKRKPYTQTELNYIYTLEDRFWSKVNIGSESECWPWTDSVGNRGYGSFSMWKINRSSTGAHCIAWILTNRRDVPAGLHIDHTCHNDTECLGGSDCLHRKCVNPTHLEPVSHKTNLLRGSTLARTNSEKLLCPNGHELSGNNLEGWGAEQGWRKCHTCTLERGRLKSQLIKQARKKLGLTRREYTAQYGQSMKVARDLMD